MSRARNAGLALALLVPAVLAGCADEAVVDDTVHAFYYGWYATEAVDGAQTHWNHEVIGDTTGLAYPGGGDIGADYYPALGPYSSADPAVVRIHVAQLKRAGVGVIVASWWGPGTPTDRNLPLLLDAAAEAGLEVAFHLEPFPGRDAVTSHAAIAYLIASYRAHPACHLMGGLPVVYVYDSYLTPPAEWARLMQPGGDLFIHDTLLDCVMIGLWVGPEDGALLDEAGFDGFYTYFAADGFTWGSSRANWPTMSRLSLGYGLIRVFCVGPGYVDTRVRPWNTATTREREDGAYFDRQFAAAIAAQTDLVAVTSFNEWHEGTQIEPAVPGACDSFTYRDYRPREPEWYLDRTRHWVRQWSRVSGR
ncbi:MAG: alpha-mannosidase [Krumholzibacteria bacterium]|nr:alpha-mannosidase [Candidatus Krumholzibacteria bacterium]